MCGGGEINKRTKLLRESHHVISEVAGATQWHTHILCTVCEGLCSLFLQRSIPLPPLSRPQKVMSHLPFYIPHICESITDTLSFTDLLKCILVNHHRHYTFIPLLWSDVITFRTKPGGLQPAEYHDYSILRHIRRGIFKNVHHIYALTCQDYQSLRILSDSSCVSLVELRDRPPHRLRRSR